MIFHDDDHRDHTILMQSGKSYLLSIIIFIITIVVAIISRRDTTREPLGIINTKKKVDGKTTHTRGVRFDDTTSIMKYDTISGSSLGIKRGILTAEKGIVGALERSALDDVIKMAGVIKEIGVEEAVIVV